MRGLTLISNDFRIEPELTAKVLRLGPELRLYEVPISYYGRSYAEGKKITWRDGFGAVGALVPLPLRRIGIASGRMATIRFSATTTATPEQFIAAVTDFGPGRSELFGNTDDSRARRARLGPDLG